MCGLMAWRKYSYCGVIFYFDNGILCLLNFCNLTSCTSTETLFFQPSILIVSCLLLWMAHWSEFASCLNMLGNFYSKARASYPWIHRWRKWQPNSHTIIRSRPTSNTSILLSDWPRAWCSHLLPGIRFLAPTLNCFGFPDTQVPYVRTRMASY